MHGVATHSPVVKSPKPSFDFTPSSAAVTRTVAPNNLRRFTNDDTKSAFLLKLTPDLVLCIADHLWYPDVFALGLVCRDLQKLMPLSAKKKSYCTELARFEASDSVQEQDEWAQNQSPTVIIRYPFCAVCLYRLERADFGWRRDDDGHDFEIRENDLRVCQQCDEFRDRQKQALEAGANSSAYPVWRRSTRVFLGGDNSLLWYRDRS